MKPMVYRTVDGKRVVAPFTVWLSHFLFDALPVFAGVALIGQFWQVEWTFRWMANVACCWIIVALLPLGIALLTPTNRLPYDLPEVMKDYNELMKQPPEPIN